MLMLAIVNFLMLNMNDVIATIQKSNVIQLIQMNTTLVKELIVIIKNIEKK